MGRALRRALRLLACALAAGSLPGAWTMAGRLAATGPQLVRSDDLAEAIEAASARLQAALARAAISAGLANATDPGARPRLEAYWQAQGDATRALDGLQKLGREPGLGWLAAPSGELRSAALAEMAALDAVIRTRRQPPPAEPDTPPTPPPDAGAAERQVAQHAAVLSSLARDHRRAEISAGLDRAAAARRALLGFVLAAALAPVLLLAAQRRRRTAWWRSTRRDPGAAGDPTGTARLYGLDDPPAPPPSTGNPPPRGLATHRPGLRVLLVEDSPMVRLSTAAMLSDLGYTVSAAGDAAEAMHLAESGLDVLVTDLGLPDLDGVTLAERLRARQPGLRIVVASGQPGEQPGMIWLQKPFDLARLDHAMEATAHGL